MRCAHCQNQTFILAERYEHFQNETLTLRGVFDTVDPKCMCFTIVIFGFDGKTEGFLSIISGNPRVPPGTGPRGSSVKPLNAFGTSNGYRYTTPVGSTARTLFTVTVLASGEKYI